MCQAMLGGAQNYDLRRKPIDQPARPRFVRLGEAAHAVQIVLATREKTPILLVEKIS